MLQIKIPSGSLRVGVLLLTLTLAACSGIFTQTATPTQTASKSTPAPAKRETPRTAIVITDDTPGYQDVTEQITQRLRVDSYRVFNLDGDPENATSVLLKLDGFSPDRVVAVGLLAAKTARQMPDVPMVFCRVFNYRDHDLISATSAGVKLLPPFELQLRAWKELAPDLETVGVITGPGQEDLIEEILASAQKHGIQVLIRTVHSNKETLYEFKRLSPLIQGLWLLPDNRILSVSVLKSLMSYGKSQGKQIVVFNDRLLKLGAVMSVTNDEGDVADQVVRLLRESRRQKAVRPTMMPLTEMRVELNSQVARDLGLSASPKFQQFLGDK